MADTFKAKPGGMRRLLKGRGAQDATHAAAERVAAYARSEAPVDSGEYRDSITVEDDPTPNRARSKVHATAAHALVVEARDNTLQKALRP